MLEEAGFVVSTLAGRDRLWQLKAEQVAALRDELARIGEQWDERLDRFWSTVERGRAGQGPR